MVAEESESSGVIIHEAFLQGLTAPRPAYTHSGKNRLYVSEFGRCPRRAMLRVQGFQPSVPFAPTLLESMSLGQSYEENSGLQLQKAFPQMLQQLVLANSTWSGKADFFVPGNPPIIIEHKSSSAAWFDYNKKLPQPENVAQAWLYGELYKELNHKPVQVILYYRAWGHYAEFEVESDSDDIVTCMGQVDGIDRIRSWESDFGVQRRLLEEHFAAGTIPEPPCGGTPNEVTGCLFRGEKSCNYFTECWR